MSATSTARPARRTARPRPTLVSIAMRSLPTLALAFVAAASLTACKRGNKTPLGSTDSAGVHSDTMAPASALAPIPKNGGDTIAAPAGAVDTTTNRPAGVPSSTGAASKAVGVDTPITRRMGSPAVRKP